MAKIATIQQPLKIRNYIINGNMDIAQRGTSFVAVANTQFPVDRFKYIKSGAMVHTATQDTDVPTVAQSGAFSAFSLRLNLTTPDTSIAAGDLCAIQQYVEGFQWANLAQKNFTLSFWVKATATGIYSVSFQNSGLDRAYIAEYTINNTNTWEYKTISVPASPSSGTWDYTTGLGIVVQFIIAGGSTGFGTVGAWTNTNTYISPNQVNGVNTGATDFRLAQVMLNEGGPVPFSMHAEGFEQELLACQRFFEKSYNMTVNPATVTTAGAWRLNPTGGVSIESTIWFKAQKRVAPTMTYYSPATGASGVTRDGTNGVDRATANLGTAGTHSVAFNITSVPAGNPDLQAHWTAESEF